MHLGGNLLICRISRASSNMMCSCHRWMQTRPTGAGSKVGLEVMPIGGVTLSDERCYGERAPTRRSVLSAVV
jgi:hypothetical protein